MLFLLTALFSGFTAQAEIWTYQVPDESFRSSVYVVTIVQGGDMRQSFTYQDRNPDEKLKRRMTDFNHFTSFAFTGRVEVRVERLDGPAEGAEVRPLAAGIRPKIEGRRIAFTLDEPAKLWIRFPGLEEHPLFLFADPPETDIPRRGDPDVIWFEGGKVHDIGGKYRVGSGQTVYIEGGAYVKGTITGRGVTKVRICGRGILSGIDIPRKPGVAGIPWNLIQFDGRGEQTVEGITCIQPPHFLILSRGRITTRNVKLMGWYHQTDGWGGGDGSVIEDSFLKANDDTVKLYHKNQAARRLTIWQQMNGAPFQLGWGAANARDCEVEDIVILRNEITRKPDKPSNTAFLNLKGQAAGNRVENLSFRNIRIEDDLLYLIGFENQRGSIRRIRMSDIEVLGRIRSQGYILTEKGGRCSDISIANLRAGGRRFASLKPILKPGAEAPQVR